MMKRPTIRDVAGRAEVSISSVSRYMRDPTSVNPIPALKIEKAIKELCYIPNTFAQTLKHGKGNTIGVVVPDLGPYFSRVCSALSDFFYQHKYLLYICETCDEAEREQYYINTLIGQQVSGLLVASSGRNQDYLETVAARFQNIVIFDRVEERLQLDTVCEDNIDNAYRLTKTMLDRGHKKFAMLFGMEYSVNTQYRRQGAMRALAEAGLSFDEQQVLVDGREASAVHEFLSSALKRSDRPTAAIAYNPLILEHALMSLNELEEDIPSSLDLAGFALHEFLSKYRYDIPCLLQSPYEMGIKAGDVMLRRLRRGDEHVSPKRYPIEVKLHLPK